MPAFNPGQEKKGLIQRLQDIAVQINPKHKVIFQHLLRKVDEGYRSVKETKKALPSARKSKFVKEVIDTLANKDSDTLREIAEAIGSYARERSKRKADVETVITKAKSEIRLLTDNLIRGKIDLDQYKLSMAGIIRKVNVATAIIGATGPVNLDGAALAKMNQILERQLRNLNTHVERIAAKLSSGKGVDKATIARALSFADNAYATSEEVLKDFLMEEFGEQLQEARELNDSVENCTECQNLAERGWVDIGTLPPIGGQLCGHNCRCQFIYRLKEDDDDDKLE